MRLSMKVVLPVCIALLASAAPAVANVTIYSPGANAKVVSPFWLSAAATPCSSQPVAAMGYSDRRQCQYDRRLQPRP